MMDNAWLAEKLRQWANLAENADLLPHDELIAELRRQATEQLAIAQRLERNAS